MLVSCVAYQDGKRLGDIKPEEIGQYVRRPECFVWVALKDPLPGELAAMQKEFDLHELAVEDAAHGHQRPKIDEYGDSLFSVLHNIEVVRTSDGPDELKVGEVNLFAGRNYVLSVRNNAEPGFREVRARCERAAVLAARGADWLVQALLDALVDQLLPVVEQLDEELAQLEVEALAHPHAQLVERLTRL